MKKFKTKKGVALLAVLVVALAAAVGAYAYFTSTGNGTGSATVGTSTALTVTQTGSVTGMLPDGVAHTVAYTIANPGTVAQNLGNVTISNITTSNPSCLATWFTVNAPANPVGTIAAATTYSSVAGTQPSIQMNDSGGNQDACQTATVSFDLNAAQGS